MSKEKEVNTPVSDAEETEVTETTPEEETATAEAEAEPTPEEKLTEELNNQKESYMRLAAEYDNYRKRTQQEKLSIYADATAKAVEELLPLADSVNAALASTPEDDAQRQGIELIGNQLMKCLEKLGVESFGETGDIFDPVYHNAVARTENEELPANALAAVFQKGFKLGDKVIRPAMVQVANCG
ncbi:MAG: nucleotide exchange factor GrpE [Ruminococcus sp.]|nr:nucleotide exchange factor GrpE [Ruminococcus sp.]